MKDKSGIEIETETHKQFERLSRAILDETVENMDGATRMRLSAMRRAALASKEKPRSWLLPSSLVTALAVLMLIWMVPQQQDNNGFDTPMEDIDLLASDVDLDLLDEVEFYQWLEDSNHAG
ncbi:MAG: hypothetical protein ACE5E3_01045 [Mariprofundus sp.]